jgi:peptidyl-Lys metalloendopeptidase
MRSSPLPGRFVAPFAFAALAGCSPSSQEAAPPAASTPVAVAAIPDASPPSDKAPSVSKPTFECTIAAPGQAPAGGPVPVTFTLRQRSPSTVHVLTWRTPLEGLRGNDFRVEREGTEVPYKGPMVKRGNPNAKSYVALEPGKDAKAEVDLALAYDFAKAGKYRIAFTGHLLDVVADAAAVPRPLDAHEPADLSCAPIDVTIVAKK